MKTVSAMDLKRTENWRIILYAKPGTGKTSSIKYLKGKTRVIDLDNSAKVLGGISPNIKIDIMDRTKPNEEIGNWIKHSSEYIVGFDNLVIDNISSFQKDWFVELGRNSHNKISNELQDYSKWTNYFARLMTEMYSLPVNILTTCWEEQRKVTAMSGQTFTQYAPSIRDSVMDGLLGLCDVVGRLTINPKTGNRGVILQGNDSVYAKNRLDDRTIVPIEELFNFKNGNENKGEDK